MFALKRDLEASLGSHYRSSDVGRYFGIPNAPGMQLAPMNRAECKLTRLVKEVPDGSRCLVEIPSQTAYFLMIYLEDVFHCDVMPDGAKTELRRYERGSACLVDLNPGASIELHSSLNAVACVLPHDLFDEIAAVSSATAPHRLICKRGEPDSVLDSLGLVLVNLFATTATPAPPDCVKYLCIAICAHLLHNYSEEVLRNGRMKASLSVWQEKAAKEFMLENLKEQISVAMVAAITGLSTNHFTHEFKRATGFTPHQWLIHMRIDHAKGLLAEEKMPLAAIADQCGFTDQSHFTKVFSRETGMTPVAWRGARLH